MKVINTNQTMRTNNFRILIIVLALFLNACKTEKSNTKENDSSTEESPYLGQNPPGLIPKPFAPGLVTTDNWEIDGVFTPGLKEFYFIRKVGEVEQNMKQEFVVFQYENNRWQESIVSPRVGQPFIAPDGKTMHLGKRYKKRTETGDWSEVKSLGAFFEDIHIMRLTASSKGTYYFEEVSSDGNSVLSYSRLIDGKHEEPKLLSKVINTGKWNAHPFIAPDESYILWDGHRDSGYGNADIYISFKQQDGSWSAAKNLGDKVNTNTSEYGASVTPDGKYLFFNRSMGYTNKNSVKYKNTDIFWVDAQIIENLRPK